MLPSLILTGTTANAIRQRVAKIKTQAKAVLEGSGPDSAFSESAAKDGKNTTKKDSGGKSTSVNNGDGVVDDEEVATPAPTRKKRATNEKGKGNGTPRGKKVKEEATEEDGEESPAKRVKTETDRGAEV